MMTFRPRTHRSSARTRGSGIRQGSGHGGWIHVDRIGVFKGCLFIAMLILFLRLFNLQVLSYDDYMTAADDEHQLSRKIQPERGSIFLRERSVSGGASQYL